MTDQANSFNDLQRFRIVAEQNIAMAAYSIDGRRFEFQAPVKSEIPNGGFVIIATSDNRQYLGQINNVELELVDGVQVAINVTEGVLGHALEEGSTLTGEGLTRVSIRAITGQGVVLAAIEDGRVLLNRGQAFANARLEAATEPVLLDYLREVTSRSAKLEIGLIRHVMPGVQVPAHLRARGLNRHTFLCGQSGSGKTFALGVILEQLLLNTAAKIVILDPNSDYVRVTDFKEQLESVNATRAIPLSDDEYATIAERYADVISQIHVFRAQSSDATAANPLKIYFSDLTIEEQATLLQLDPLQDMTLYNVFMQIVEQMPGDRFTLDELHRALLAKSLELETRELGLRIQNLGISKWEIWADSHDHSLTEFMQTDDWRCLVVDTGSLASPTEQSVIAMSVLGRLWRQRNQREPIIVVIDEAHNLCPHEPLNELVHMSTQSCIQIAGEGRKYGLYLLLATQRPSKIHPNVLSQCDNLILMRMNSVQDIQHIKETLSFAPAALVAQSAYFDLGESLVAGNIVATPMFARFGGRLTHEGGADVSSAWARKR